jgi:hypothetical protein
VIYNPRTLNRAALLAALALCFGLAGCASTTVETAGVTLKQPLCEAGAEKLSVLVLWGPVWRPDQKEPSLREAAALRGIQDFFASIDCVAHADIRRLDGGQSAKVPADTELFALASSAAPVPDRVLVIVVRELGPTLLIGVPVLVEGSTEAVLELRVLDVHANQSVANFRTHWKNGGTFVIKGVKTLAEDMTAALRATLAPGAASR